MLLQYDREAAQRTVVIDDQADHHTDIKTTWLTQNEQDQALNEAQDLFRKMHTRQNITMSLNF
jgi:hypothetical protein